MNYWKEIEKTAPFATASKRIKYLGIRLTKEVTGLYLGREACRRFQSQLSPSSPDTDVFPTVAPAVTSRDKLSRLCPVSTPSPQNP